MATLISATSGNISNFVWNYVLDTYVPMTGTNSTFAQFAATASSLTFSTNLSYATFSGGWSVSHIGIKLAHGVTVSGTLSVAIGFVPDGSTLTSSTIVANSRVDYSLNSLPYYMTAKELNALYYTTPSVSFASKPQTGFLSMNNNSQPIFGESLALSNNPSGVLPNGYGGGYFTYNTWLIFKLPQIISLTNSVYTILYTIGTTARDTPTFVYSYNRTDLRPTLNCLLVTTATQSRNVGDNLIIAGEYFGSTSSNTWQVSMNATASTPTFSSISIGSNGILNFTTASNYNSYLQMNGYLDVGGNGKINIGVSGSAIPTSSTAKLEFTATYSYGVSPGNWFVTDGIFLRMGSEFNTFGATNTWRTNLTKTLTANSSTISVSPSINWSTGDFVVITPTEAYSQSEEFILSSNSNGFTVSIGPSVSAFVHTSTFSYSAEVVNLTRNIKIGSPYLNYGFYICNYYGILNFNNTEIYNNGFRWTEGITSTPLTASFYRNGIYSPCNLAVTFSYFNMDGTSLRYTTQAFSSTVLCLADGTELADASVGPSQRSQEIYNFNVNNSIIYKLRGGIILGREYYSPTDLNSTVQRYYFDKNGGKSYDKTNNLTNNIFIGGYNISSLSGGGNSISYINCVTDIKFEGNKVTGFYGKGSSDVYSDYFCIAFGGNGIRTTYQNSINNNTIIANNYGIYLVANNTELSGFTISNLNIIKTGNSNTSGLTTLLGTDVTLYNLNIIGCLNYGLSLYHTTIPNSGPIKIVNSTFSDCVYSVGGSYVGQFTFADNVNLSFYNCYFKSTTQDIFLNQAQSSNDSNNYRIFLDNCVSVSPILFTSSNNGFNSKSYIKVKNLNGVTGSFKTWQSFGIIESDSTIKRLVNNSVRIRPNTTFNTPSGNNVISATASSIYIQGSKKVVPVFKNNITNINVWIRKSKTADGANYNGSQPRLVVGANSYIGVAYDTVLATTKLANGIFENISATFSSPNDSVAEFWVECNGNTGWINIDDWNISYT